MKSQELKPLSLVKAGQRVRIVRVDAGQNLNSRLSSMGIIPTVELTVINNAYPGPIIVNVKNSKVMLGRGMAHKIMVI